MEKRNSKNRKDSTRDRHLKWINYYCSKNFGIWVECSNCKKWRRTYQFSESHEVPENWCCSMLTLENGEKGSCDDPEEDTDELYLEYSPGSVVWAKLEGFPWWPAMVDVDPDVEEFLWRENGTLHYNVTFLDEKPTRAWIPELFICPFLKPPRKGKKFRQNRYAKAISKAKERAESAMKMTIKDRLQTYSFVHLYKGHWPAASNFEEVDNEENGQKNSEDMAGILLKELDELGSVCSTDTDDERIEKDFSEQENKMAEKGKLISKNADTLNLKKKTYNTKYLNNNDFIPENEAVFPLMKKKNSKYSSSVKKASSNAKHQAESITNPLQENSAKGVKRKPNRKFTPRKEKNLKKLSENLIDDIIDLENTDSEQKSNVNSNAVSVPKEDDSKSLHAPEEDSMARDSSLSEVPNSESPHFEHVSDENVSAVIEKKMNSKYFHDPKECFMVGGNDKDLSEVPIYEKRKTENQTGNLKTLHDENVLKHIDESISSGSNPLQENAAKGVKRKPNRKFTSRKEKNFKKLSENLIDDIIDFESADSEQKSNENSNAVSVPKEDDSKSLHAPEEDSMARDSSLSEVPNSESPHFEHVSDENVSAVTEKKMNSKYFHDLKEGFMVEGNDKDLSEVPIYEKRKTENQTGNLKTLHDENVLKHINESISKVLESAENENLETSNESCSSGQKKIKTSNELQKKSVKQKKSQNFLENIKQSNSKTAKLEENVTQISQVSPETKVLQNVSNSTSKINKIIKPVTTKQTKKPQKTIKPINGKMDEFPKQSSSSFSIHIKDIKQKDEVIEDKDTRAGNMNKENKILKSTPQNPLKDLNPSVKVKPNFKQPVKEISQDKIKNVKKFAGTGKPTLSNIKQNNSDEYKENSRNNLVKSGEGKNSCVNEKSTENLQSKDVVSVPEVVLIHDEDSIPNNDTMKSTENHDNLFYVSLSDEDIDCETLKA